MPVRDLAFRIEAIPPRGAKVPASAFKEIAGGNALNAAIGIARLGGRAALTGAMGDAGETSARIIFEQLAQEGIDSRHLVHLPGLVTPISAVMIDESGERTTSLPRSRCVGATADAGTLLEGCSAVLIEGRWRRLLHRPVRRGAPRGLPVVVD